MVTRYPIRSRAPSPPRSRALRRALSPPLSTESVDNSTVAVPLAFWLDHADRAPLDPGQRLAQPVGARGAQVLFSREDPGLQVLFEDARYYADPQSMDECPRTVHESARRTLQALQAAGTGATFEGGAVS